MAHLPLIVKPCKTGQEYTSFLFYLSSCPVLVFVEYNFLWSRTGMYQPFTLFTCHPVLYLFYKNRLLFSGGIRLLVIMLCCNVGNHDVAHVGILAVAVVRGDQGRFHVHAGIVL